MRLVALLCSSHRWDTEPQRGSVSYLRSQHKLVSDGAGFQIQESVSSGQTLCFLFLFFFLRWSLALSPGWSAVAQSWLTATSDYLVQVILLPQSPE